MLQRRSHHKSRRGCLSCKQRKVKCDEMGPPCGNCRARATECEYANPTSGLQGSSTSGGPAIKGIDFNLSPGNPSYPKSRQLLKLQLMHRWSTITYKTISTPNTEDYLVWQRTVPEVALKHDFLLNGLFAVSAFEIAHPAENGNMRYVSAALEYQGLAFHSFQAQLRDVTPDSHEAVLYFSILLLVLALASTQYVAATGELDSKVQNMVTQFGLLRGVGMVMLSMQDCIATHPLFNHVKPISKLPRVPLDSTTETAMGRLKELNEIRIRSTFGESCHDRAQAILYAESCKKALFWLRECFVTCVEIEYQGYCLAWIGLAGDDYITAIKERDRIALLILMYWGILVERLGYEYWWARNFGNSLIDEISEGVQGDADELTRDVILWARQQVCNGREKKKEHELKTSIHDGLLF